MLLEERAGGKVTQKERSQKEESQLQAQVKSE